MFVKLFRQICIVAALLATSQAANASFHLWQINELFSNADGTVQFIELSVSAGQEQFIAGQTITSSSAGHATKSFTFPSNLPGDSANKTFLIGTQGFAALNIVAPDYTVPNGFLYTNNGSVNYAGLNSIDYATLPTDGSLSLNRDGTTSVNSPKNFAGATGTVSLIDYTGAWYNANESGWGLSVIRGTTGLYGIIMYHFNQTSNPTWYFMAGGSFSGTTYSAPVTLYSGPSFTSPTFNSAQVSSSTVGTASINFTSATTANLTYTISGTMVTKALTKLQF
jgi:hypothetical protein